MHEIFALRLICWFDARSALFGIGTGTTAQGGESAQPYRPARFRLQLRPNLPGASKNWKKEQLEKLQHTEEQKNHCR